MKIKFDRFEHTIPISSDKASFLEIQNRVVFAKVVQSLQDEGLDQAIEPFSLWNEDGTERKKRGSVFLFINNLPSLPLTDRKLIGSLIKKLTKSVNTDFEISSEITALTLKIEDLIEQKESKFKGSYDFELDYALESFIKALSFGSAARSNESLLEKGISFLDLCSDIELKKVLVFVNAKSFFLPEEIQKLIDHAIFLKIPVLFLESWHDDVIYNNSSKMCIDQHFLEFI